ncbi:MAG: 4-phosphoerythronate dehydrogenase PdxB [Dysgonamonadaceae bacterium]
MKILADLHIPFLKGVVEHFGEVDYLPGNQFTKAAIQDKDALIVRTVTYFGKEILEGTNVKLICSATIGYDHIDTEYCDNHNIAWRTAPGCNANSVEQYITSSLLFMCKKQGFELKDKTIGIVGVGNVGSKVEAVCRKLGMRVLLSDPPRQENEQSSDYVDIDTIQKEADIITFHTPLTKSGPHKTFHLVNDDFFNSLVKKPIIMNAARGGIVNNLSLKAALIDGKVSGAVIDCWEHEPNIDLELLNLVDIGTPHIAGYSADGKWMGTKISLENLNEYFHLGFNNIPMPSLPDPIQDKTIDLSKISPSNQLAYAVRHTYDPLIETENLRMHPEKFYWCRSNYPIRREYKAFSIIGEDKYNTEILSHLGFIII